MTRSIAIFLLCAFAWAAPAGAAGPSLEQYYNSTEDLAMPAVKPEAVAPAPPAMEKEEPPPKHVPQSHVVTSVKKCFQEIGAAAAAQIRQASLTPYADCQKRLRIMEEEKKKTESEETVAETPRNYRRVSLGEEPPVAKKDKN